MNRFSRTNRNFRTMKVRKGGVKIQSKTPYPKRLISSEFLKIAQEKTNIIDSMTQERVHQLDKFNSVYIEDGEDQEMLESSVKKSSTDKKSKKSDDGLSSQKSKKQSKQHNLNLNRKAQKLDMINANQMQVLIEETPTTTLFFKKSFYLQSTKEEDLKKQEKSNQEYLRKTKEAKGNENFTKHSTQTFNFVEKQKEIQTDEIDYRDEGISTQCFNIDHEMKIDQKTNIEKRLDCIHLTIEEQIEKLDQNPFTYLPCDTNAIVYYIKSKRDVKKRGTKNNRKLKNSMNFSKNSTRLNYTSQITKDSFDRETRENNSNVLNTKGVTKNRGVKKNLSNFGTMYNKNYIENEMIKFKESIEREQKHLLMFDSEKKVFE